MESEYLSVAETAKLLRSALKKYFPATKFSVRSDSYSGGASINVGWTDGPTIKKVKRITNQFTGADFDGMIDLKTYNSSWLMPDGSACIAHDPGTEGSRGVLPKIDNPKPHPDARQVHFGADYIFTNRAHSVAAFTKAAEQVCAKYGYQMARISADYSGANFAWDDPLREQGADNPTSIWTLNNLTHKLLEREYPWDEEFTTGCEPTQPQPGSPEYEALKQRIAELEAQLAR